MSRGMISRLMEYEEWKNPPSRKDGSTEEDELKILRQSNLFITELAKQLSLDQHIINTAMVYYLTFTRIQSHDSLNPYLLSCACLMLAAKALD